ncbi:hypothetical protein ABPG74_000204 [Tetrahymena malaccensis]
MTSTIFSNIFWISFFLITIACQQATDFVYSPLHLKKHDIQDQEGASTKIKVAEKANLVFVSAGGEGIIVLDGSTNEIIFRMPTKEFLFCIEATTDGEFVMFSYQQQFSVFKFENRSRLILLSQAQFPTSIIDMFINSQENTVFAAGVNGQLVAYDISNKISVQQVGYFNSKSNIIHKGYISKDDNWILLGNDYLGLVVLKLVVDQYQNKIEFQLAGQGTTTWKTWAAIVTDDLDYAYALDNWFGIYICDFKQITAASQSQYPVTIVFTYFWPFPNLYLQYTAKLTKNNKYLIIGFRSVGIFIFDIQNRLNPTLFQSIPVTGQALSINISPNEQFLYFANALSIYVFERRPANLNNNYPNLFNIQQSKLQNTSSAYYKWRCFNRKINEIDYFFGAFDSGGIFIFNASDPYNLVQIFSKQFNPPPFVDSMDISLDKKYLYVPVQSDNISFVVYDIQNITSPQEAFKLNIGNSNYEETIVLSNDLNYLLSSNDNGILLLDASRPPTLKLLTSWTVLPFMTGENAGVMITHDNKYIIGTVRNYGFYVLDATVKTKLIYKSSLQTLGAENIISSKYTDEYAYLLDGFKGVAILDLTVLPQISILSRIPLQGWANFQVLVNQDKYLLTVVMENEMLILIDIQDKKNPQILSKYQYQTQSAHSICLSTDEKFSYINNQFGTITLPLVSKVKIHTEFQKINVQANGSQLLESLSKDENLLVGQYIQLQFVFIYPVNGIKIVSVNFYSQFQKLPLPFWMNYNQENGIVQIKVDKSGLDSNNLYAPNLNTILLKVITPLYPTSFQFDSQEVKTNSIESQQIYSALQNINLIDAMGYVTDLFDPQKSLYFELNGKNYTKRFYQMTQLVMQQSISINPVIFYIENSLSINITDLKNPIKTLSDTVSLLLSVDSLHGKFVMQGFTGVIASTNDSQNQIKLEGSLSNINSILSKSLIFANTTNMQAIDVTITVIDGINYDVTQVQLISSCIFIKQKDQIQKNINNSLQLQFNKQQTNGQVDILTFFSISFAKNSFIVKDVETINYSVFLLQGLEYKQLTSDDWIQFQDVSGQIQISGMPPASSFKKAFYLKVVATDGYTQDFDIFYINASGLPLVLVFDILIKVLGPTFALLGLYKYKSYVLNIIFVKKITYSSETAYVGQKFFKKITLADDQLEKSQLLFNEFLQKFKKNKEQLNKQQQFQTKKQEKEIKDLPKNKNESSLKQNDIEQNFHPLRRLKILTDHPSKNDDYLKKSINIIKMSSQNPKKNFLENEYLDKDGSVNMQKIIREILIQNYSFNLKGKKIFASSLLSSLKNSESVIFNGVKAMAVRYFLKLDLRSYQIYKYIKYYAKKYHNYTNNDWYKLIITINPTEDKDYYDSPVPFSQLVLNEQQLNLILIDLQVHNKIGQSFDSLQNLGINYHLIKEALFADAKGLTENTRSVFFPSQGESIHLFQYEIQSVEAFKKVENTWFTKLRKAFNFEYASYGISKSQNLPNWLQLEYKKGVLILKGTPQSEDEESILIRIIDQDLQTIQQFMLNIVHEYSEKDFDIVYPKKLQDIEETEGLLFQSRTNSMRKCEISQVNSPILKSQRLNNNVLMYNKQILSEEYNQNEKINNMSDAKQLNQMKDMQESPVQNSIYDQSIFFDKFYNRNDEINEDSKQNILFLLGLNKTAEQHQDYVFQQRKLQEMLQSYQQIQQIDLNQSPLITYRSEEKRNILNYQQATLCGKELDDHQLKNQC